jgi:hypothetical protein
MEASEAALRFAVCLGTAESFYRQNAFAVGGRLCSPEACGGYFWLDFPIFPPQWILPLES